MHDIIIKDSRLEWAERQLLNCRLCPRDCGINRMSGEIGWCGAGAEASYYMEYVHYGEEPAIVPSHTIYLTGCNLRCCFCHTARERRIKPSKRLTPDRLNRIIEKGRLERARNINILGGDPTVNLPALLILFSKMPNLPPVVWNSSLYCSAEALSALQGIPDIYLTDFKFGNNQCAERLSETTGYVDVLTARIKELFVNEGADRIIIRHLVLPGHIECCTRPILDWIARHANSVSVSLKFDYLVMPWVKTDHDLKRFLSVNEIEKVKKIALNAGINVMQNESNNTWVSKKNHITATQHTEETEIVISPNGNVFLQHPAREITELLLSINENN